MSMDEKYKLFRQFMYNELGISKDDIKEWCREAVLEVATTYVNEEFKRRSLDLRIHDIIAEESYGWHTKKDIEQRVKNKVSSILASQFEIVLKEKPDGD